MNIGKLESFCYEVVRFFSVSINAVTTSLVSNVRNFNKVRSL